MQKREAEPRLGETSPLARSMLVLSPWGLNGGYSGPLVLLDRLCEALSSKNLQIDVLYRDRGIEHQPSWVNSSFIMSSSRPDQSTIRDQLLWIWNVRLFLKKNAHRYDAIHLQGAYLGNLLPFVWLSSSRKAILFPVLENGDLKSSKYILIRCVKTAVISHLAKNVAHAFSLSDGIAGELREAGIPTSRISNIPNIVNTDIFRPPKSRQSSKVPFTIGFVGKLGAKKQPHLILEAMDLLKKKKILTNAVFVGPFENDTYEAYFQKKLTDFGLNEDVQIKYFQADVHKFHHEMDVFVLPSKGEGMPGALVEAMSSGLPAVVTDVGSMGTVVRSADAGLVLDRVSASLLAEAIYSLIIDGKGLASLSINAREYAVINFSDKAVADYYYNTIFSLSDSKKESS